VADERPEPAERVAPAERRAALVAGLRRLAGLIGAAVAITAVGSLVFGVLLHTELLHALAIGFYGAGSVFIVVGFFYGVRPPVRTTGQGGGSTLLGSAAASGGRARWADRHDIEDSLATSAVFLVLGIALIAAGVLFDPRNRLL
jgi:hypothetical protein